MFYRLVGRLPPGGVNRNDRRRTRQPNLADYLTNKELGFKTSCVNNRLTLNGAVFQEDWKNIHSPSIPPAAAASPSCVTPAAPRIRASRRTLAGRDLQLHAHRRRGLLQLQVRHRLLRLQTMRRRAGDQLPARHGSRRRRSNDPTDDELLRRHRRPKGTRLPVDRELVKGKPDRPLRVRLDGWRRHFAGAVVHEGERRPTYVEPTTKFSATCPRTLLVDPLRGFRRNNWAVKFYVKNAFDKRAELGRYAQVWHSLRAAGLVPEYPERHATVITNRRAPSASLLPGILRTVSRA
jgi:hypothetical protein